MKLPEGDTSIDKLIKSWDIDYTIEKRLKKRHLHIHIMFKIFHFTKLQLIYDKIKNKICINLGLNNVYCYNILLKSNESENVQDYINK